MVLALQQEAAAAVAGRPWAQGARAATRVGQQAEPPSAVAQGVTGQQAGAGAAAAGGGAPTAHSHQALLVPPWGHPGLLLAAVAVAVAVAGTVAAAAWTRAAPAGSRGEARVAAEAATGGERVPPPMGLAVASTCATAEAEVVVVVVGVAVVVRGTPTAAGGGTRAAAAVARLAGSGSLPGTPAEGPGVATSASQPGLQPAPEAPAPTAVWEWVRAQQAWTTATGAAAGKAAQQ